MPATLEAGHGDAPLAEAPRPRRGRPRLLPPDPDARAPGRRASKTAALALSRIPGEVAGLELLLRDPAQSLGRRDGDALAIAEAAAASPAYRRLLRLSQTPLPPPRKRRTQDVSRRLRSLLRAALAVALENRTLRLRLELRCRIYRAALRRLDMPQPKFKKGI